MCNAVINHVFLTWIVFEHMKSGWPIIFVSACMQFLFTTIRKQSNKQGHLLFIYFKEHLYKSAILHAEYWYEPLPTSLMCQIFSNILYPTGLCIKPERISTCSKEVTLNEVINTRPQIFLATINL